MGSFPASSMRPSRPAPAPEWESGSTAIWPSGRPLTAPKPGPIRTVWPSGCGSGRRPTSSTSLVRTGGSSLQSPAPCASRPMSRLRQPCGRPCNTAARCGSDHVMGLARLYWIAKGAAGGRRHLCRLFPSTICWAVVRLGKPPQPLQDRRRGPGHRARGLPRASRRPRVSCPTGVMYFRARGRRRLHRPRTLSGAGAGHGVHPRPADAGRLLERLRPRREGAVGPVFVGRSRGRGTAWPRR